MSEYSMITAVIKKKKIDNFIQNSTNLNVSVFEKVPILQLLTNIDYKQKQEYDSNQLILFDLR